MLAGFASSIRGIKEKARSVKIKQGGGENGQMKDDWLHETT